MDTMFENLDFRFDKENNDERPFMNKEQQWIKKHPVMWFLLQKISDFLWFFVKFSICMILWYIIHG